MVLLLVCIRLAVIDWKKNPIIKFFGGVQGNMNDFTAHEQKKFITPKSIIWFIIAMIVMGGYYFLINIGLMNVQGLDFFYLWSAGSGG
jgi:hypothetical protein